jgi:hypothetical protein
LKCKRHKVAAITAFPTPFKLSVQCSHQNGKLLTLVAIDSVKHQEIAVASAITNAVALPHPGLHVRLMHAGMIKQLSPAMHLSRRM